MNTTQFRIGYTDVILNDYEIGKGKLIISDDNYGYNFAYYWGAMGDGYTLSTFLQKLNEGYFVGKLGTSSKGEIDMKKTMKSVREWWRTESGIKWYEYMDAQKELREVFKEIQNWYCDDRSFVDKMQNLTKDIDSVLFDRKGEYKYFKEALEGLESEPWYFIVYKEHEQNEWLRLFLPKLKNKLKELSS